jgi:hypothetical protein
MRRLIPAKQLFEKFRLASPVELVRRAFASRSGGERGSQEDLGSKDSMIRIDGDADRAL